MTFYKIGNWIVQMGGPVNKKAKKAILYKVFNLIGFLICMFFLATIIRMFIQ